MAQKKTAGTLKVPLFDLTYDEVFPKFSHSSTRVFQEMDLVLFIFEYLAQFLANIKLSINILT